jgi:hypothetical protein
MKDLSKYIESLIDEVNLPLDITLQEDGSYRIVVTQDLKESTVRYTNAAWNNETDIRWIRVQLKRYVPNLKIKLMVGYINYPKIYTKPLVKLGDLLARAKDMRNIKQATIVTPKAENEVMLKKEEAEQVDETMMGKAGCTSEDDKKKAEKPVDYDKPTFLRKVNDWRKSNPKFQPKKLPMSKAAAGALAAEEFVSEAHFMEIPSDVKKEIKKHIDNDDHDAMTTALMRCID